MAAIATTLECLDQGAHSFAADDLYGGCCRLFERVRARSAGLEVRPIVDLTDPRRSRRRSGRHPAHLGRGAHQSAPELIDLDAIAAIARQRGIWAAADNTFASPYVQRPLEHGFDLVVHSTTEYLNGHSDMVGGVAVVGGNPSCGSG